MKAVIAPVCVQPGTALNETISGQERPRTAGKSLFVGKEKFFVRGVTYGTFRPDADGNPFPNVAAVERDFSLMVQNGANCVRVYTVPPRWLLDTAQRYGLRVMVGIPWEQHITFLHNQTRVRAIKRHVRNGISACAEHPAVLCYAVGNEVPAPIVRWHGRRAIEAFIQGLCRIAKEQDPNGLVTYVNYPSTEYLRLPCADLFCFNVYLESQKHLAAYLARLHNLAGDRPVLLAEVGLDSQRNGLETQARTLDWQIRTAFANGCAGAFVFAWTDEWHRGAHDIESWDFGLTTRERRPKPALDSVREAFADTPFASRSVWPRISVVVCTHNGSRTIRDCLEGLRRLEYPNHEVIVVNDGSTDQTETILHEYAIRLITTENRGLSAARNIGLEAARGEIVAYIDDDAYPDPHWLHYLASTFTTTDFAAVGGPNIAPSGDGSTADCVVNSPGGPVHVLLSDHEAEHIPGCNMAFRRSCLRVIGGFDPQFRTAGDDVDICWRIQQHGWKIGFNPVAVVWHHRRNSLRAYWRQQRGYGKAEALLERKWPEKYNTIGHIKWSGRLYGRGLTHMLMRTQRVYHGLWGSAPFQSLRESAPGPISVLPTMPEWYLVVIALGMLSAIALLWPKLVVALPLFVLAAGATLVQAILSASHASFPSRPKSLVKRTQLYALTTFLHLVQPLARLWGRIGHGLTAWRFRLPYALLLPFPQNRSVWSETWRSSEEILQRITDGLREESATLVLGGDYDRWDLEVRGGTLAAARVLMTVEEHGCGKQLFRFRSWPRFASEGILAIVVFTALTVGAALDEYWLAYDILALIALGLGVRVLFESASAMAAAQRAINRAFSKEPSAGGAP